MPQVQLCGAWVPYGRTRVHLGQEKCMELTLILGSIDLFWLMIMALGSLVEIFNVNACSTAISWGDFMREKNNRFLMWHVKWWSRS